METFKFKIKFILGILCIQSSVHGHPAATEEPKEQEIITDTGIHQFMVLDTLRNSIADHREAITTITFQIKSILERLETNENRSTIGMQETISTHLERLDKKNSNPHFIIDTLNIYSDGKTDNNVPCKKNSTSGEESNQTLISHNLIQQINEMAETQKRLERKLADIEKGCCKSGLETTIKSFENVPTEIAKSPYSNKLYIFPKEEKLTFHEAKIFCEQRNSTLASIHSKGEYNFVEDWLSTHYKVYSHFWLGHQRPKNDAFSGSSANTWHDGTEIDYAAWGPVDNGGRPNPSGCMFMCHYCGANINGWYIRPCSDRFNLLCQKVLSIK